ncbi:sugar ABC transporter ATP-binding protein [Cryobacterium sp. PH31-O1]|uniref:sugar ABC transporter ATP-binding protein n=1 Tax=Cryobacterium sp. PH31-O1 TaxID=3046306 RepID=UPI0024BA096C|nr:sugar ABC transporter ATP-binding protein [Cryobacterium sp. PH31-O1]MDJ0336682.1 sugar ABC transporter ATP-binding protein [Cryobacterium sp. PH31-O1]
MAIEPSAAQQHAATQPVAFEVRGVSKSYPGVKALDAVSLTGYAGEVLAICGANGAGKSTLARMLAGQELPSDGDIRISGYEGRIDGPAAADDAGILLMHQEPVIIDSFTVSENLWLKNLSSANKVRPWGFVSRKKTETTLAALRSVGLEGVSPERLGKDLGPGLRQMLALSRTQVNRHQILLLDETTASTTEEHFKDVQSLVERERAAGVSVVFVSHRMPEVFAMADRIAVLRNGKLIDVVRTVDTTPDEVMTLMIGEAVSALESPPSIETTLDPILEVTGLSSGSATNISFTVQPGEVLGIYGLVGSGRSSVARSISGNQSRDAGVVKLHGKPVHAKSPRDAVRQGIAYLTEDRRREGFVKDFTNGENMTLATLQHFSTWGVISRRRERKRVNELIREYQVKGEAGVYTRTLSGGNQQKVIIAKWIEARPEVVILDEPTKGIDVGARLNIYQIIRALARDGKGIIVVTSEAEEALMLCNRILVLEEGRIVGEYQPATSTTDDLIRASLGGEIA